MPIVPAGAVHQTELANAVKKAVRRLSKDIVRVNYNIGTDSTDDPAIFFRIVLTNAASKEEKLGAVASRIGRVLSDEIRPYEKWGLYPYFSFRSESEQKERNDPEWG